MDKIKFFGFDMDYTLACKYELDNGKILKKYLLMNLDIKICIL